MAAAAQNFALAPRPATRDAVAAWMKERNVILRGPDVGIKTTRSLDVLPFGDLNGEPTLPLSVLMTRSTLRLSAFVGLAIASLAFLA